MASPLRMVAPAGTPIRLADLGRWAGGAIFSRGKARENFGERICEELSVGHCFFVSTGRAALAVVLMSLRRMAGEDRDEVVIPSYTCYSVPSSIAMAGLKVRVADIDPGTFDYEYAQLEQLDYSKVLCVVSANLYGIPNDLVRLSELAERKGVFLVDDAAQALGGRVDGKASGTFGTAGIYSLDKGKNITSIEGGIIVTDSAELAAVIGEQEKAFPDSPTLTKAINVGKLLVYALFLHPRLFWIPDRLPFLNLGATIYSTDYGISAYSESLASMATVLFAQRDRINAERVKHASWLREKLKDLEGLEHLTVRAGIEPVYLRYPVLIEDAIRREGILQSLRRRGIGASPSYPRAIPEVPQIRGTLAGGTSDGRGGRKVARRIVTLPTHPYVTERDLEVMAEECSRAAGG